MERDGGRVNRNGRNERLEMATRERDEGERGALLHGLIGFSLG